MRRCHMHGLDENTLKDMLQINRYQTRIKYNYIKDGTRALIQYKDVILPV